MSIITHESCTVKSTGKTFPYMQILPDGYDGSKTYPLAIFLHGLGEGGDHLDLVAVHGWPRYAKEGVASYPFILVCPQLPANGFWMSCVESLNGFLDYLLETLPVDPKRVYLTGLSNGGTGTWLWGMCNPERFAAIAPVCGAATQWMFFSLLKTPVWAFHGEEDGTIACRESVEMVTNLQNNGGNAKLTVYPGVGHGCWELAYQDPDLVAWLMEQHLDEKEACI